MQICAILPYVPYPIDRGVYQRVFHLVEELGKIHDLDLFCLNESPEKKRTFRDF